MTLKYVALAGFVVTAGLTAPVARAAQAPPAQSPTAPVVVTVTLDERKVELSSTTLKPGPTTFKTTNVAKGTHTLKVESEKLDDAKAKKISQELPHDLKKDETGEMTIDLKPGTYNAICPIGLGAHKRKGMQQMFTVVAKKP